MLTSNLERDFVYLVRHMRPSDAAQVAALKIPGVYLLREYQRFYPAGEVTGHLLGFTKKYEDIGQEGLELAYDRWLGAEAGAKRVIQDRYGRTVEDIESIRAPRPGSDLVTSIDLRIQYLAYRELKAAVQLHQAKAGSMIVLDVETRRDSRDGESARRTTRTIATRSRRRVIAIARRPTSSSRAPASSRSSPRRASLRVAFTPNTIIDTTPVRVGVKLIEDHKFLGSIPLTTVLAKSSNVGMAKMALTLSPQQHARHADAPSASARYRAAVFPANQPDCSTMRRIGGASDRRRSSYGYGLSVTPLQLAHAYATLGVRRRQSAGHVATRRCAGRRATRPR